MPAACSVGKVTSEIRLLRSMPSGQRLDSPARMSRREATVTPSAATGTAPSFVAQAMRSTSKPSPGLNCPLSFFTWRALAQAPLPRERSPGRSELRNDRPFRLGCAPQWALTSDGIIINIRRLTSDDIFRVIIEPLIFSCPWPRLNDLEEVIGERIRSIHVET